jgi:hypothetical protein
MRKTALFFFVTAIIVLKTTRTIKISNCGSFLWAMPIWNGTRL